MNNEQCQYAFLAKRCFTVGWASAHHNKETQMRTDQVAKAPTHMEVQEYNND
ncbi:hypothetical protein [Sulfurovum riftiae]|uniref:hypothetical protein n=1 Tax=Sulfurovum riftiae TaxID=1630136 RepID=UPI000A8B4254|nr:hypothetical protein [Sulfurovum riftiae]